MAGDPHSYRNSKPSLAVDGELMPSKGATKVLFVEDDSIDQLTFEHYVKHQKINYDYTIVRDVREAVEAIENNSFEVIIVDYLLPDGTAFDVLRASQNTPVIFITGAGNEEVAVKAIKSGAYDYVIKDNTNNHLKVLPITVEKALERYSTVERKRELEDQLRVSERQAYTGSVAAGIANDMNNILGSILGFAELASDDVNNVSELNKDIKEVICAAKKATYLLQEVLSLNYSGTTSASPRKPTAFGPVIDTVLDRMASSIPTSVTVSKKVKEVAGNYSIDAGNAYQIVNNLCANAIAAMKSTGGVLSVTLTEIERGALPAAVAGEIRCDYCTRLTVKDSGLGMEPAVKNRIFEPFFTTKAPESIGLGLVVVNSLVLKAGGVIKVESEVGKGTVVDVYLPYRKESQENLSSDLLLPKANLELLMGKRICIVEGDEQLTRLFNRIFSDVPCEIKIFSSSNEVFNKFTPTNSCDCDIIILDDTIDSVDSQVLARRIATLAPSTPIVVWCNYLRELSQRSVRKIGMGYYLDKPLEIERLLRTLTLIAESVVK